MFPSFRRAAAYTLACCVLSSVPLAPARAQASTVFCMMDGSAIEASRFEAKDGKFLIFVGNATTPQEYPFSAVKGVNVSPCSSIAVTAPTPSFGVHGSNTIGERLMPMLIEAYSKHKFGSAPVVRMTGAEEQQITLTPPGGAPVVIDLRAHGSGTAAKGLVENRAAIGMASRRLNAEEVKSIADKFNIDPLSADSEHVLALDGLAVIVHPSNPVKSLTLEQLAQIFSGKIASWKDLGGPDRPINALRRDDKSGTFDTFKTLVLAPTHVDFARTTKPFESSEMLSDSVSRDPDAIGFVALPYANKNAIISISSSCGISNRPTKFSIKAEEYPLSRRLYLYSIDTHLNDVSRDLLRYTLSNDAQPVIQDAEFVDQAISFQDEAEQRQWAGEAVNGLDAAARKSIPRDALADFQRLASTSRRASTMLRFKSGSSSLDNKAAQDIIRLSQYLTGKRFHVVGFADSKGDWRVNQTLAAKRAKEVADSLRLIGLETLPNAVTAFAYLAPIACNDSADHDGKNRRVEIWIDN